MNKFLSQLWASKMLNTGQKGDTEIYSFLVQFKSYENQKF